MGAPSFVLSKDNNTIKKQSPQDSCSAYLSLIQQYLNLFQVDNAIFLAERCIAEYPNSQEALYLLALCHYRNGKIKNARSCLAKCNDMNHSMLFLAAQCSYELGDYNRAENVMMTSVREAYNKAKDSSSMLSFDDWILHTTPCPVPNGATGLALLGKICRKSCCTDRAIKYFRMSLQLDPFLFTSFQALAELGVELDAANIFGGNIPAVKTMKDSQNVSQHHSFMASDNSVKTPLQPMTSGILTAAGRRPFETPGLTPISSNITSNDNSTSMQTPAHEHSIVIRRARQIASRQYYPPSPDTPLTSVTRSMRYLRGLGGTEGGAGRSLFASSENQSTNANTNAAPLTTHTATGAAVSSALSNMNTYSKPEKEESDEKVQDILDILSITGAVYLNICQYRCKEALHFIQKLPVHHQRTPWVLHQQGRAYLEQGDFLAAQRSLEYMHKLDPGRTKGLELLSTVYWQLKKEIDLANLAQRTMDWDYESPEAHCVAGNCFSLQKDHETALVFFKRSLQLDPDFTYTHTLSGYEYMSNEDFEKATKCFREALRTDERHYNAWYGLGAIYHRQEKYDLAECHFERAVSLHKSSSVLRCNLGMAQNANGKAYQALETLAEAFRLDPRNPQARFQRATIYSALHRPEEALAELQIVRDAAPREATVHFAMGKVMKRLGRPHEAMKCFLTAMDLDPKDSQLIKSAMDKLDEPEIDEESMTNF